LQGWSNTQLNARIKAEKICLQVREAYEILTDPEERERFETNFPNIHVEWAKYYQDLELWERYSAAEAEAEAAYTKAKHEIEEQERRRTIWIMGERERERRASKAYEQELHNLHGIDHRYCTCRGCTRGRRRKNYEQSNGIGIPTPDEYAAYLQMKADEAEARSREAMRQRREEQEREATERLRKEAEKTERVKKTEERKRAAKLKVKDERSKETARRAHEQQEKDAQMRMARQHVKMQQEHYLCETEKGREEPGAGVVIDIKWTKKKGAAKCLFCDAVIKHYAFVCPDGGAIACNPCKNGMCRFVLPREDEEEANGCEDKSGVTQESADDEMEEEVSVL
jgi:hypothetical protein